MSQRLANVMDTLSTSLAPTGELLSKLMSPFVWVVEKVAGWLGRINQLTRGWFGLFIVGGLVVWGFRLLLAALLQAVAALRAFTLATLLRGGAGAAGAGGAAGTAIDLALLWQALGLSAISAALIRFGALVRVAFADFRAAFAAIRNASGLWAALRALPQLVSGLWSAIRMAAITDIPKVVSLLGGIWRFITAPVRLLGGLLKWIGGLFGGLVAVLAKLALIATVVVAAVLGVVSLVQMLAGVKWEQTVLSDAIEAVRNLFTGKGFRADETVAWEEEMRRSRSQSAADRPNRRSSIELWWAKRWAEVGG